jgi:hypothetical protein
VDDEVVSGETLGEFSSLASATGAISDSFDFSIFGSIPGSRIALCGKGSRGGGHLDCPAKRTE